MQRIFLASFLVFTFAFATACASGGGAAGGDASAESSVTSQIPASSPLSKIELGMSESQVRQALGEPTHTNAYATGKAWIPFYYGSDTARSDWMYKGVGRVVFSRNRYSGGLKVIELVHNPAEQ